MFDGWPRQSWRGFYCLVDTGAGDTRSRLAEPKSRSICLAESPLFAFTMSAAAMNRCGSDRLRAVGNSSGYCAELLTALGIEAFVH